MKLYAVTCYHSARYAVYPMFYYISEDRSKCEAVLFEKQKNKIWASKYSITEIETDKELNYLIGQEYY